MEFLDYYDENGKLLGKETREVIHTKGLWHKTVHCWLYDGLGNVYFQLRKDMKDNTNKMYTTASGHVAAGETLRQAFAREVKEEIGIDVDINACQLVEMTVWKMDMQKKDGNVVKDRAYANVYASKIGNSLPKFLFSDGEVLGIMKVSAKEALELLKKESGSISAIKIDAKNKTQQVKITMDNFLINPTEIGIIKYGKILQFVMNETK
ncbi:MAG: NUDIX domain-containing protein [Christensenellaceae bacterium]|jgi:isopentenyldiphosphate isomerase|nr:NUDIX domain-containing protein [Christensenellaceae bacterium]